MLNTSVDDRNEREVLESLAGELPVHAADVAAVQVPLRPFANVDAFGTKIYAVDAVADTCFLHAE